MTTEVLRNMIYARSPTLEGLRNAVLDEVHYLQDPARGAVWEEVIIHLPAEIAIVALSATVSNAEEVAAWMQTVRGETEAIIEERRRSSSRTSTWSATAGAERCTSCRPSSTTPASRARIRSSPASTGARAGAGQPRRRPRLCKPWRTEVVERLADEQMLPGDRVRVLAAPVATRPSSSALRAGCGSRPPPTGVALRRIADAHLENLADDDLDVLGYDSWIAGLEAGVAAHHAGMVPPMKEAVEEAFTAGLLKVVFATETLSLGINMPARSVVVEKLSKFTGEHHELLTPGEYTQLAGRAGRRGIDDVGYAVVLWDPFVGFDQVAGLASRRTYALTSSFRATYNMAANLVQRYPRRKRAACSTCRSRSITPTATPWPHPAAREDPRAARAGARRGPDPARRHRGVPGVARIAGRRRAAAHAVQDSRLDKLRPGDVVMAPRARRSGGRPEAGARPVGQPCAGAHPAAHDGAPDPRRLPGPIRRVATIELPRPFAPRSPAFQRATVALLRRLPDRDDPTADDADARVRDVEAADARPPAARRDRHRGRAPRRVAGRPDRARRRPARTAHRGQDRNARPASSIACSPCSSRGATCAAGSCSRAAGCSPGSTPSAISCRRSVAQRPARRPRRRGADHDRVVLRLPAPRARRRRADAAARWPTRSVRRALCATSSASRMTSI